MPDVSVVDGSAAVVKPLCELETEEESGDREIG